MSYKSCVITVIIIFITIGSYCQTSFFTTYGGTNIEKPTYIKKLGGSYFVCQTITREPYEVKRVTQIVKLDSNGLFIKDTILENIANEFAVIQLLLPKTDTSFLVIGHYKNTGQNEMIWIIEMNMELEIIWQKSVCTGNYNINKISYTLNDNGNIMLAMACVLNPNPILLFCEVTFDGDSIRSVSYNHGSYHDVDVESIIYKNDKYYVSVDGFNAFVPLGSCASQIITLDSSLNIVNYDIAPKLIDLFRHAEVLNDFYYLLGGMSLTFDSSFDLTILKLNYQNELINFKYIGQSGNLVDYSARSKCLSISNNNLIYFGGTANDNGMDFSCPLENKRFILSNLDSLLNSRWTYFYGGNACYILSAIEATDDGGCVMAGMKYDEETPDQSLDPVIIKVDSTGIITSSNIIGIAATNSLLYPNPGKDYIMLQSGQQLQNCKFKLYNNRGILVKERNITDREIKINTSDLSAGIHYWRIDKNSSTIENGKWIKIN